MSFQLSSGNPELAKHSSDLANGRLSQISTNWLDVFAAHGDARDQRLEAQQELLLRYAGAIYRYVLSAVRDTHAADDLTQEFAFRFVRGDFRRADPEQGRFRDFLKRALINLITDHYRRQRKRSRMTDVYVVESSTGDCESRLETSFDEVWRQELLARTWQALADSDRQTRSAFTVVLRFRAEHPELTSAQMADQLVIPLERTVSSAWVRQTLRRARARFGELLRVEVRRTLRTSNDDAVDDELASIGLLKYTPR